MLRGPPFAGVIGRDPKLRAVRSFDKCIRVLLAFLARRAPRPRMLRGPPLAGIIGTEPELRAVLSFDKRVRVLLALLAPERYAMRYRVLVLALARRSLWQSLLTGTHRCQPTTRDAPE